MYSVFLNFRGEDVRKSFISHLIRELNQKGIRSFKDEEEEVEDEKKRGKQISASLHRAISESYVALVVLSKNYSSSVGCLDELDKIMDRARQKLTVVVPVFYEVDLSDVKYQRGGFREDFERHGQVESPKTLKRKDEAKLVRDITRHVSGLLSESRLHKELLPGKACGDKSAIKKTRLHSASDQFMATKSEISSNLVAMDRHLELMKGVLALKSTNEVRVIGISGVKGIGKTTIAKFIYQELSPDFQEHYFLETSTNIHEHLSGNQSIGQISIASNRCKQSTPAFQNHCLLATSMNFYDQGHVGRASSSGSPKEILSPRGKKRKASQTSSDLGSEAKRARIGDQRALVIVDNVETIKQLGEIMKDAKCLGRFCPGSRVIVTTEDKSLLLARGVEHVYEMDCLKYDEGLELFSECAFQKQYPPANFEQLSARAVEVTGCLPLALKLLGSSLRDRTEEEWECEILRLEARQDADLPKETPIGSAPGLSKFKAQGIGSAPGPKELWEYKCIGSKLEQQKER
uniref:TIR domain-containing protein n=1 Tax=Brassica campestris TaxID=3711 RepID=M4CV11_BRACM